MGLLDSILSLLGGDKPKEVKRPQGPGLNVGEAKVRKKVGLPTSAKETRNSSRRKDGSLSKPKPQLKAKNAKPKSYREHKREVVEAFPSLFVEDAMPYGMQLLEDKRGDTGMSDAALQSLNFAAGNAALGMVGKGAGSLGGMMRGKKVVEPIDNVVPIRPLKTADTKALTRKMHKEYADELKQLDETPATDPATMERRAFLERILSGEKVPPPTRKGYTSGGRPDHPNRPRPA